MKIIKKLYEQHLNSEKQEVSYEVELLWRLENEAYEKIVATLTDAQKKLLGELLDVYGASLLAETEQAYRVGVSTGIRLIFEALEG